MYEKARKLVETETFRQSIRFIVAGIAATVVNFTVNGLVFQFMFSGKNRVLFEIAHTADGFRGLVIYASSLSGGAGFLSGLLVGFPLNKFWAFRSDTKINFKENAKYFGVYLFSFVLTLILSPLSYKLFNGILNLHEMLRGLPASESFYYIPVIFVTTVVNFTGCKFLVFKKEKYERK